jgi:dTDP-4-amino-4,6-dideoxygalactose transaminase
MGEGGMLVVKDQKIANIIPMLRHNGHCTFSHERENYWTPAMGNVHLPELNSQPIWPNNYCLGEVECALGVKLLDRIDCINEDKRKRALKFIDAMIDFPQLEFHREASERHNYYLLAARVTNGKRDLFMSKMAEAGVQCVVQFYPLNRYDFYKQLGYGEADCPSTDQFFDNMVSFPFNHMLSDADFDEMIAITKKTLSTL